MSAEGGTHETQHFSAQIKAIDGNRAEVACLDAIVRFDLIGKRVFATLVNPAVVGDIVTVKVRRNHRRPEDKMTPSEKLFPHWEFYI